MGKDILTSIETSKLMTGLLLTSAALVGVVIYMTGKEIYAAKKTNKKLKIVKDIKKEISSNDGTTKGGTTEETSNCAGCMSSVIGKKYEMPNNLKRADFR